MVENRENIRRRKLVDYLKANLGKGYKLDELKWALIKQGHSRTDVLAAMEQAQAEMPEKKPVEEKPKIVREVFNEPVVVENKPWWKFW